MRNVLSWVIAVILAVSAVMPPVYAQTAAALPVVNSLLPLSEPVEPLLIKGLTLHPEDPLLFDFILDKGDNAKAIQGADRMLADVDINHLIKYFLAALTVPEKDLWVNLSPYEKDRIIPESFGKTELGRDLLAQDYILKQVAASVLYPDGKEGKNFWDKVYAEAFKHYGTTDVPVDTFNKVWIVPAKAKVYENNGSVIVIDSQLKVMLDADHTSTQAHDVGATGRSPLHADNNLSSRHSDLDDIPRQIMREIIIPILEKEVNEGRNFAPLRQIYHAVILASWYKDSLKRSLLSQVYVDRNKVSGVESGDPEAKAGIYARYVEAYRSGVYNYVREEHDPLTGTMIPRKYASGGAHLNTKEIRQVVTRLSGSDRAQLASDLQGASSVRVRLVDIAPEGAMRVNLEGISTKYQKKMERVRQRVLAEFKGDYLKDFEHGLPHAESVLTTIRSIVFKKGIADRINWPLMLAAVMLHDTNARETKEHGPLAAEAAGRILLSEFSEAEMSRLKRVILLHDDYTPEGSQARRDLGIEAELLYGADVIDAFGIKGVYRFISTYVKREKLVQGRDLTTAEIIFMVRNKIVPNVQDRFHSLDDDDIKELAGPLYDQLMEFMDQLKTENFGDNGTSGAQVVVNMINAHLDQSPWELAADMQSFLKASDDKVSDDSREAHQYALEYFTSLLQEYPLPVAEIGSLTYDWKLSELLEADPRLKFQMSSWSPDQLTELSRLVDPLIRGVFWGESEQGFKQIIHGLKQLLSKSSPRESDAADWVLAQLKAQARVIFNDDSVPLDIHVFHMASVNAAKGFIKALALKKEKTTIVYGREVDALMVKEHFPGYRMEEISHYRKPGVLQIRFDGHGSPLVNYSARAFVVTLPLIPFKFDIPSTSAGDVDGMKKALGISQERQVIIVGSPTEDEFSQFMQVYNSLYQHLSFSDRPLLIVAFRNILDPEVILNKESLSGQSVEVRSNKSAPLLKVTDKSVLVLNTMGELWKMYGLDHVTVLGEDRNIIEPASAKSAILYFDGEWYFNRESWDALVSHGGAQIFNQQNLARLMGNSSEAYAMGKKAGEVAEIYRTNIESKVEEAIMQMIGASPVMREMFIGSIQELVLARDGAQISSAEYGGVDLTRIDRDLQVQSDGRSTQLNVSPDRFWQLQNAQGFEHRVISVEPLSSSSLLFQTYK